MRAQREAAKNQLPQKVEVVEIPQDDCWFRDSGCTVRYPRPHYRWRGRLRPPSCHILAPQSMRAVA